MPLIRAMVDEASYRREGNRNILRLIVRAERLDGKRSSGDVSVEWGGTMRVYFWGTRGSLPVGPDGAVIRQKIKQALLKANGRRFDNEIDVERFIDAELDFPIRHSYGGNTSCVEIIGRQALHAVRHGFRPALFWPASYAETWPGPTAGLQLFHVARALGPHHGVSFFHARLYSWQYDCVFMAAIRSPSSKKRFAASSPTPVFRLIGISCGRISFRPPGSWALVRSRRPER